MNDEDVKSLNILIMTPEAHELVGDCPYCHAPKYKWEKIAGSWHCPGCSYDFPDGQPDGIPPKDEASPKASEPEWPEEVNTEEADWPSGRPEDDDLPGPSGGMNDDEPDASVIPPLDESVVGRAYRLREDHLWGYDTAPRTDNKKEGFFNKRMEPITGPAADFSEPDEEIRENRTSSTEMDRFGEWDTDSRIFKAMGEQRVFCEGVEHGDLAMRENAGCPKCGGPMPMDWPRSVCPACHEGGALSESADAKLMAVADSLSGVLDIFFPELKSIYTDAIESGDADALKTLIRTIDQEVLGSPSDYNEQVVRIIKRFKESFMSDLDLANQEEGDRYPSFDYTPGIEDGPDTFPQDNIEREDREREEEMHRWDELDAEEEEF